MKRLPTLSLLIATLFISMQLTSTASADYRSRPHIDYELLCQHADDLKYISKDLQAVFTDHFIRSRVYGKLINRTVRIRGAANRLHRHGLAKTPCDWRHEINKLDRLVFELNALVDEALYYSRTGYDKPICNTAVRPVRKLIRKADYHVRGLERSLLQAEAAKYKRPHFRDAPAPLWTPRAPIPNNSCRLGRYDNAAFSQRLRYDRSHYNPYSAGSTGFAGTGSLAGIGEGLAFNLGGLKFYLNR